jgi:glutamate synthase domain-containing protein 1
MPSPIPASRLAWAGDLPASRAACGIGFVATPELGHRAVALGVTALARLAHRGGLDADGKSGDGAGLMIQVPERLLGGHFAVAAMFEWDPRAKALLEESLEAGGLRLLEWREVPT